jgi:hypothetical protein
MITIRAFKATEEMETCLQFLEGHRKVLEEFNLANISTNTPKWINHEGSYVVIAEYNNEIIGGARMQLVDDKMLLPVQEAVAHFDPKINDLVKDKNNNGGACELCGLWNARTLPPNLGLTRLVSIAAVSLAEQLNIKNIFAICAGYTLYPAIRMGMVVQKNVGNNGEFIYPNSNFRARVLCMDGLTLETSNEEFRNEINNLKLNPNFKTILKINDTSLPLQFNLALKEMSYGN